jgi:SAM-dependent methyltransferase
MAELQGGVLEPEDPDYENDLALEENAASSTVSIGPSILNYRKENGRTYHAYKDGKYAFPNDEPEKDRLDLQHHVFSLTFDGELFTCPVAQKKQIHQVLDVGTGTGIWAIDFGDKYPKAQVLGIDLSPIQPVFVPPNVKFEVDDLEEPWDFLYKFDFIYSRMMIGSFVDIPRFVEQSFENLAPGGYLEMVDLCYPIKTIDDTFPKDSALLNWFVYLLQKAVFWSTNKNRSDLLMEACEKVGRLANSPQFFKDQMTAAGFTNVVETKHYWPSNQWPKDKKLKEIGLFYHRFAEHGAERRIGMWQLEKMSGPGGLEAVTVGLFTRVLGWTKVETDVLMAKVRNELKDTKIHSYWDM